MTNRRNKSWTGWTEFFRHIRPSVDESVDGVSRAVVLRGLNEDYIDHDDMCEPYAAMIDPKWDMTG